VLIKNVEMILQTMDLSLRPIFSKIDSKEYFESCSLSCFNLDCFINKFATNTAINSLTDIELAAFAEKIIQMLLMLRA
jgi:hypothetical protein